MDLLSRISVSLHISLWVLEDLKNALPVVFKQVQFALSDFVSLFLASPLYPF
jgi:hypothetical protein